MLATFAHPSIEFTCAHGDELTYRLPATSSCLDVSGRFSMQKPNRDLHFEKLIIQISYKPSGWGRRWLYKKLFISMRRV
ncbi:hypothetical protein VAA_02979 [Vibrio anguillarum 775]|nr:hypothetical protein VAA_02979 [Vibrio anguillarum 775]